MLASEVASAEVSRGFCDVACLERAMAGLFLVFAVLVVLFPPSNTTGALTLRLERDLEDIGVDKEDGRDLVK